MPSRRILILLGAFAAGFGLLVARLAQLQIVETDEHKRRAEARRAWRETLPAPRGRILAAGGEPLARDDAAYDVLAFPDEVQDPGALAALLGEAQQDVERRLVAGMAAFLEGMSPEQIRAFREAEADEEAGTAAQANGRSKPAPRLWTRRAHPIAFDLARADVLRIAEAAERFPELSIATRRIRRVPEGALAAHLVGTVGAITAEDVKRRTGVDISAPGGWREAARVLREKGLRLSDAVGRSGLERAFEETLRGREGYRVFEKDPKGRRIRLLEEVAPTPGADLRLSLDVRLQRAAEESISGHRGAAVFLDCRTGAVLALASSPGFDPNHPKTQSGPDIPALNRAISGLYPAGSAMKVVTAAAGLRTGAIDRETSFDCQKHFPGSASFQCEGLHGPISLPEAMQRSCNIFFCHTADAIHRRRGSALPDEARAFGFGERTGIDLPGEAEGSVPSTPNPGDARNLALGQGALLVTPIQIARMIAAIANGGFLVTPRLEAGIPLSPIPIEGLEPKVLAEIRKDLELVVMESGGTAHRAYLEAKPGVNIAGKTGTAQAPGGSHAWFAGYAPAEAPRIAFAIIWENAGVHGSEAAREIFRAVGAWAAAPPTAPSSGREAPEDTPSP